MMEVPLSLHELFFSLSLRNIEGPTFSLLRTLGLGLLSGPNFLICFFIPIIMRQRCCYCDEERLKPCYRSQKQSNKHKQRKNENTE